MQILLGNLPLSDIVKPEYLDQIQSFFDTHGYHHTPRCHDVVNARGNYHIYDTPTMIMICDSGKLEEFMSFLRTEGIIECAFTDLIAVSSEPCKGDA